MDDLQLVAIEGVSGSVDPSCSVVDGHHPLNAGAELTDLAVVDGHQQLLSTVRRKILEAVELLAKTGRLHLLVDFEAGCD